MASRTVAELLSDTRTGSKPDSAVSNDTRMTFAGSAADHAGVAQDGGDQHATAGARGAVPAPWPAAGVATTRARISTVHAAFYPVCEHRTTQKPNPANVPFSSTLMLRRHIAQVTGRLQPAVDRITSNPWIRRNFPALADPDLWHVNRRSAARAVAIGLFCGLIPGPLQALAAIVACLVIRANFPIAVVTTFYTNPFTIVPLYLIAYEYGRLFFPNAPPSVACSLPPSFGLDGLPARAAPLDGRSSASRSPSAS